MQGLTEFLPISSSGHLVLFQTLFGLKEPQLFLDIMLHLGTLLAVVVYFRTDLWKIIQGIGTILRREGKDHEGTNLLLWIFVASLPTGLMGLFLKDWFESFFSKPRMVGVLLVFTGLLLGVTRWIRTGNKSIGNMKWTDALLIGTAQGLAILPGISRSGATISAGLLCGLDRELAGKFSFLLSIPAILGATLLELRQVGSGEPLLPVLAGAAIAFGVGLLSLASLIKIVKSGKLFNFSYYCCALGGAMIIFL